jgi:hypothetical protein
VLNHILGISTTGLVGKIKFDALGNLQETLVLKQYQKFKSAYADIMIGNWNPDGDKLTVGTIDWRVFGSAGQQNALQSFFSHPCAADEYIITGYDACCWTCWKCAAGEIINENRTGCQKCPRFWWPQDSINQCVPIQPTFLQYTDYLPIILFAVAAASGALSFIVMLVYLCNRQHRLVLATSVPLSLIMQLGTLCAAGVIVIFALPPETLAVCVARFYGLHITINMIYSPLLIKMVRIYRIFKGGPKKMNFVSTRKQILLALALIMVQVSRLWTLRHSVFEHELASS